jgi:hypothetical protein
MEPPGANKQVCGSVCAAALLTTVHLFKYMSCGGGYMSLRRTQGTKRTRYQCTKTMDLLTASLGADHSSGIIMVRR